MDIRITNGTYGLRIGAELSPKTRSDPPFSVPDEEAERLVALGVAEYAAENGAEAPESPQEAAGGPERTEGMIPPCRDEDGAMDETEGVPGENEPAPGMLPFAPGSDKMPEGPVISGDDIAEMPPNAAQSAEAELDLSALTVAQLRELAAQMGAEVKGLRTKAELIAAIEATKPPDPQVIA